MCHYYPQRRKAIISYYAIDKELKEARKSAALALLKKLRKLLNKGGRSCEFMFFDLQRPAATLPRPENSERKARITHFKQRATTLGLLAHELRFEYYGPRITMADGTHEEALSLLVVPLKKRVSTEFSKQEVLEFLEFVYRDCYGDFYKMEDSQYQQFHEYLDRQIEAYKVSLPDVITSV